MHDALRTVRFGLDANDCQPIAFNWTFDAVVPPHVEDRTHMRDGYRVSAELVRYHQTGVGHGWVEVDGERIADCSTAKNARRLHQIRDTVIHVLDPVGGGEGWGNCQPIITGDHPDLGLSGDTSFM